MKQVSDAELEALGLAPPPRPVVPRGLDKLPMRQRLQAVQVRAPRPRGGGGRPRRGVAGSCAGRLCAEWQPAHMPAACGAQLLAAYGP